MEASQSKHGHSWDCFSFSVFLFVCLVLVFSPKLALAKEAILFGFILVVSFSYSETLFPFELITFSSCE